MAKICQNGADNGVAMGLAPLTKTRFGGRLPRIFLGS
jgi:hypothetical protein